MAQDIKNASKVAPNEATIESRSKILVALFIYSDRGRKEIEVHCRNQNE